MRSLGNSGLLTDGQGRQVVDDLHGRNAHCHDPGEQVDDVAGVPDLAGPVVRVIDYARCREPGMPSGRPGSTGQDRPAGPPPSTRYAPFARPSTRYFPFAAR